MQVSRRIALVVAFAVAAAATAAWAQKPNYRAYGACMEGRGYTIK